MACLYQDRTLNPINRPVTRYVLLGLSLLPVSLNTAADEGQKQPINPVLEQAKSIKGQIKHNNPRPESYQTVADGKSDGKSDLSARQKVDGGYWSLDESHALIMASSLDQANTFYSQQKYEDARREFEHALATDKGNLSAWRGLGWSYWSLGQKQKAYQVWTDLLTVFPENIPTLIAISKAYEQDQNWQEAERYDRQIVKLQPNNSDAYQGLARVYMANQKFSWAEKAARSALNVTPDNVSALSLLADALMGQGRYLQAQTVLQTLIMIQPIPANLRRLGRSQAEIGHFQEAAQSYQKSYQLDQSADTLAAWRGVGNSLVKINQNQKAYAIWQAILLEQPTDIPTLLAMGRASEKDQHWQEGLLVYAQILQKYPLNNEALQGRAKIFTAQKDYASAVKELRLVLEHSPQDNEAKTLLAENLVALGQTTEAAQMLASVVDVAPTYKKLSRLGTILEDAGKDEEASRYFQKSLELAPEDSKAILGLAHAYWQQQNYSQSIKLLKDYLAKYPNNEAVRIRLAEHASADDNWLLAEEQLRYLNAQHPQDSKWLTRLAVLLHRAGRHQEATTTAINLLAHEPRNVIALELLADDALFSGNLNRAIDWMTRLISVAPTADRVNSLGNIYLQIGEQLFKQGQFEASTKQFNQATENFRHAASLDAIKTGAPIQLIKTLRMEGHSHEAISYGQQLQAKYPISIEVNKQLADAYQDQGSYSEAHASLARNAVFSPDSPVIQQRLAELTYHKGDREQAFDSLEYLLENAKAPTIPILLYHGITLSDHRESVAMKNFRDQLHALKREGYQSISIQQLLGFYQGQQALPSKPILITFDDARVDSFKYADPVLEETGFKATMFVPANDISTHHPYTSVWQRLRDMHNTGRWDLQCHGSSAHHFIPISAEGHLGHFLANKQWLPEAGRLETRQEYTTRIENDLLLCKQTLAREISGISLNAFAFPFGDQGHRSLSNFPESFAINQSIVKKHFPLAFNVDNSYLASVQTPHTLLPRFEVPRSYSSVDLIEQLKRMDPALSTTKKLAQLEIESGRLGRAQSRIESLLANHSADKPELLMTSGKLSSWQGDHAFARQQFQQAFQLQPNDLLVQKEIDELNDRLRPAVHANGLYFEDNAYRSYHSYGPTANVALSDRLIASVLYKYLDYRQTLNHGKKDLLDYNSTGNQVTGQINYEIAARSSLSLHAGFADFSGHITPSNNHSDSTFAVGGGNITTGISDRVELALAVDHTYVNTAGGIMMGLAFTRIKGAVTSKLSDFLTLNVNHAYFDYSQNNQRNRTEVELDRAIWDKPNMTLGLQFIHDNTQNFNPLFWTPINYLSFSAPLNLKTNLSESVVAELGLAPGLGKESANEFKFQFTGAGSINWFLNKDFNLNVTVNRYQAATYSNFSAFVGLGLKF